MACIIPPTLQNPFVWNEIVEKFQTDFAADLNWVENIYPIAEVGELEIGTNDEPNRIMVPMILMQDGTNNHINLFPDSRLKSLMFFELENGDMEFNFRDDLSTIMINIVFADALVNEPASLFSIKTKFTIDIDISTIIVNAYPVNVYGEVSIIAYIR